MNEICHKLHKLVSGLVRIRFPFDTNIMPTNGIYFLFENGESAHGTDRIVRIGTHTGNNQLPSRLKQHFIHENKDRSIFRKNIGRAILSMGNSPFLSQWEIDLTTSKAKQKYASLIDQTLLQETEKRVTEYIQRNMSFVLIPEGSKVRRLVLEAGIISTVSLCEDCKPSTQWLGLHSPKAKIRESGLWLVNELYKRPLSESDYEILEATINGAQKASAPAHHICGSSCRNLDNPSPEPNPWKPEWSARARFEEGDCKTWMWLRPNSEIRGDTIPQSYAMTIDGAAYGRQRWGIESTDGSGWRKLEEIRKTGLGEATFEDLRYCLFIICRAMHWDGDADETEMASLANDFRSYHDALCSAWKREWRRNCEKLPNLSAAGLR